MDGGTRAWEGHGEWASEQPLRPEGIQVYEETDEQVYWSIRRVDGSRILRKDFANQGFIGFYPLGERS